jgi:hypothetical protein
MSFNICRGTLGSLAMRDKECLVARQPLHRHLPLWLVSEIEVSDLLAVGVLHDEGFLTLLEQTSNYALS